MQGREQNGAEFARAGGTQLALARMTLEARMRVDNGGDGGRAGSVLAGVFGPVSYTHLTLPTNEFV